MREVLSEIRESKLLIAAIAASLLLLGTAVVVFVINRAPWTPAPYEVPEAIAVTPEVRPGERLRMGFRIIRRRVCQIDLDRFIVSVERGEPEMRQRVPGGATPVGNAWTVVDIPVPPELEPGDYTYRTTITNTCPDGVYVTQTPEVKFKVLPAP